MTTYCPIVLETEASGATSADVPGLPVYAAADTHKRAERAVREMLLEYLEAHPRGIAWHAGSSGARCPARVQGSALKSSEWRNELTPELTPSTMTVGPGASAWIGQYACLPVSHV